MAVLVNPPCVIFEDDDILVVNKPAGMNTHAPSPYAGEGIYDWLNHREPRWANLAIVHRLDKETSGVIVFAKTVLANRSLTGQFSNRLVRKKYLLVTDRPVRRGEFATKSALVRVGERYATRPLQAGGVRAETRFRVIHSTRRETVVEAKPITGRTHQIRVHAAANGFPIFGDGLYGGTPANRVCLHAEQLVFRHPATGKAVAFEGPVNFLADPGPALRSALIDPEETNAYRLIHGASDGWPGWYVDRLGDVLLSQSERTLADKQREALTVWLKRFSLRGAYHQTFARQIPKTSGARLSPEKVLGDDAPDEFMVRESGLRFELRFDQGHSVGLFLDQRENRRRLLTGHVAAGFPLSGEGERPRKPGNEDHGSSVASPFGPLAGMQLLNAFAYTCGFSVCAALAGARTTSLDLSKKYLEWGKRNFALNGLDTERHDFIFGDAFDWLRRLAKKKRKFEVIALDPPTFSQSKEHGVFQAEKDFGELVAAASPLLKAGGVLFASTNAARLTAETFLAQVTAVIHSARRKIVQQHYVPQPPDFPVSRDEPAYLRTVWIRIA